MDGRDEAPEPSEASSSQQPYGKLLLKVQHATGRGPEGHLFWDPRFSKGFVEVKVADEHSSRVTTSAKPVEDFEINWMEEIAVDLAQDSQRVVVKLVGGENDEPGPCVGCCGIYLDQVVGQESPVDKYFNLFRASPNGDYERGGYIRMSLDLESDNDWEPVPSHSEEQPRQVPLQLSRTPSPLFHDARSHLHAFPYVADDDLLPSTPHSSLPIVVNASLVATSRSDSVGHAHDRPQTPWPLPVGRSSFGSSEDYGLWYDRPGTPLPFGRGTTLTFYDDEDDEEPVAGHPASSADMAGDVMEDATEGIIVTARDFGQGPDRCVDDGDDDNDNGRQRRSVVDGDGLNGSDDVSGACRADASVLDFPASRMTSVQNENYFRRLEDGTAITVPVFVSRNGVDDQDQGGEGGGNVVGNDRSRGFLLQEVGGVPRLNLTLLARDEEEAMGTLRVISGRQRDEGIESTVTGASTEDMLLSSEIPLLDTTPLLSPMRETSMEETYSVQQLHQQATNEYYDEYTINNREQCFQDDGSSEAGASETDSQISGITRKFSPRLFLAAVVIGGVAALALGVLRGLIQRSEKSRKSKADADESYSEHYEFHLVV